MATPEMNRLYIEKFKLWKQLVNMKDFVRGSVVMLKRPCIYKGCRKCKSGIKHPTIYYSISRKNKTTLIYLPRDIQAMVKEMIKNYKEILSLLDKISEINIEIIRLRIKERRTKGVK